MKNLFYSLVVLLFTIVVAEIVIRAFIDLPDPYAHLRVKVKTTSGVIRLQNPRNDDFYFYFEPSDIYPLDEPNIIPIHINNFGFRHQEDIDPQQKGEYRIFAIGGSTTQNYDYTYDKTWTQVLEKNLENEFRSKINVYNGGTAGAAMVDHIALLQNRVMHLLPDFVILFIGINDLNLLVGDENPYRFTDIYDDAESISWYKLALGRLTLYKLFLNIQQKIKDNAISQKEDEKRKEINPEIEVGTNIVFISHKGMIKETESLPEADFPDVNFAYYKSFVKSFIGSCITNGVKLMVITQPTTWNTEDEQLAAHHWINKNKKNRFPKKDMQDAMDFMNKEVAKICKNNNIPCFRADKVLPKTKEYFFDDCHFTPKGSVALGDSISNFIIKNKIIEIN